MSEQSDIAINEISSVKVISDNRVLIISNSDNTRVIRFDDFKKELLNSATNEGANFGGGIRGTTAEFVGTKGSINIGFRDGGKTGDIVRFTGDSNKYIVSSLYTSPIYFGCATPDSIEGMKLANMSMVIKPLEVEILNAFTAGHGNFRNSVSTGPDLTSVEWKEAYDTVQPGFGRFIERSGEGDSGTMEGTLIANEGFRAGFEGINFLGTSGDGLEFRSISHFYKGSERVGSISIDPGTKKNLSISALDSLILKGDFVELVDSEFTKLRTSSYGVEITTKGAIKIPSGNISERPDPTIGKGLLRFNTELGDSGELEVSDGTEWSTVGKGGGGEVPGESSEPIFSRDIVSTLNIGGISVNQTFLEGSLIEDAIAALISPYQTSSLRNLSMVKSPIDSVVEVGRVVSIHSAIIHSDADSEGAHPTNITLTGGPGFDGIFTPGVSKAATTGTTVMLPTPSTITWISRGLNSKGTVISGPSISIRSQNMYLVGGSPLVIPQTSGNAVAQTLMSSLQYKTLTADKVVTMNTGSWSDVLENSTYIAYRASYGDLSGIVMNDSVSVLGAFTKVGNYVYTNTYGISESYIIYKSNSTKAFPSGTKLAIK